MIGTRPKAREHETKIYKLQEEYSLKPSARKKRKEKIDYDDPKQVRTNKTNSTSGSKR